MTLLILVLWISNSIIVLSQVKILLQVLLGLLQKVLLGLLQKVLLSLLQKVLLGLLQMQEILMMLGPLLGLWEVLSESSLSL